MTPPPEPCGARWTNTRSGHVVHHRCDEPAGHEPPHVCGLRRGGLGPKVSRWCHVRWLVRDDGSVQCLTLAPWQKQRKQPFEGVNTTEPVEGDAR